MPASHRQRQQQQLTPAGIGHPLVRAFLEAKRHCGSEGRNVVALEGLWAIRHAIDASLQFEAVFVCTALMHHDGDETRRALEQLRRTGSVQVLEVGERVLRRMVDRDGPDGLAALAHMPRAVLTELRVPRIARVLVADGLELPGNVGTIIRCADGAGADAVVLTGTGTGAGARAGTGVRPTHPLVLKASMATALSMPTVTAGRHEALAWLRARGFRIVAAHPAATTSYRATDYGERTAVVVGSERLGLAPFWHDAADALVSIPMLGVADSLNVGHAAALLLYEALHQQRYVRSTRVRPGQGTKPSGNSHS